MTPLSKKHHYIPQFYLRGFTDTNGGFTIYDKVRNEFRKSRPENEFYEKFRNTTNLGGEKSVMVEDMYSHIESTFATTLSAIEKSNHTEPVLTSDIMVGLKFLVETMRWRNPALDAVYESIVQRLSIKDFGLQFKGATDKQAVEINKRIMDEPDARKMLRPLMGSLSINSMANANYDTSKWHILYQEGGFPITGDFPIIFNPKSIHDRINEEFIFPLSAQRTAVFADIKLMKQLPDVFSIDKDLAIIHLAKRFVCCKHDEYLKFMINYYKRNRTEINEQFLEGIFLTLQKGT
ncbi:DUF4238 domain-containing protein [Hymenobacter elongatus]|uniref:DUF4238 domain-containing protein n=1 Tax=Hymenobacter elongatus TaxID=877208 RepID=A0A4Z0PFH3_9BACT|nr:DUF4238 domain-containing protein [Hymenobacter elongatus]TGE13867.1 DUF4238 domain-containing protein [Hymenobacter elongatus]